MEENRIINVLLNNNLNNNYIKQKNTETSILNIDDVYDILDKKGIISGISNTTKIYNLDLVNELINQCGDTLTNVKHILILLETGPQISLDINIKFMEQVTNLEKNYGLHPLLDLKTNNNLHKDEISYKLLYVVDTISQDYLNTFHALETNEIDTRLYKQTYNENHILRKKLENSMTENEKLKRQIKRLEESLMILECN